MIATGNKRNINPTVLDRCFDLSSADSHRSFGDYMHPTNFVFKYNCGGLVLPSPAVAATLKQRGGGESLANCAQQILQPYYSNLTLSRIKIHTEIPWIIQKTAKITPAAITIDEDIYFSHKGSGGYEPDTIAGIKLLAHELTHTQ